MFYKKEKGLEIGSFLYILFFRKGEKMAQGVITKIGREKLCKAHAGDSNLPPITQMGFGNGGVEADGTVIPTTGDEITLRNELLRKDIHSHSYPETTSCRYSTRLDKLDLANQNISEMGLFDSNGDLVAYKTFLPKGKDDDMEFVFDMDEIF